MSDKIRDYLGYAVCGLTAVVVIWVLTKSDHPKFSARVMSEREVLVTMGGEPQAFTYGNHSYGTTELCLSHSQVRPTCFRSPDLRADSREAQSIALTPQWPY